VQERKPQHPSSIKPQHRAQSRTHWRFTARNQRIIVSGCHHTKALLTHSFQIAACRNTSSALLSHTNHFKLQLALNFEYPSWFKYSHKRQENSRWVYFPVKHESRQTHQCGVPLQKLLMSLSHCSWAACDLVQHHSTS
jgi:hypothetical protein